MWATSRRSSSLQSRILDQQKPTTLHGEVLEDALALGDLQLFQISASLEPMRDVLDAKLWGQRGFVSVKTWMLRRRAAWRCDELAYLSPAPSQWRRDLDALSR